MPYHVIGADNDSIICSDSQTGEQRQNYSSKSEFSGHQDTLRRMSVNYGLLLPFLHLSNIISVCFWLMAQHFFIYLFNVYLYRDK